MHLSRILAVAALAGALSVGFACTNSGLGLPDDSASADTDPDVTAPTGGGGDTCDHVGTWRLEKVQCGSFTVGTWFDNYAEVTMTLADGADACDGTLSWSGPECGEEEVFTADFTAEGLVTVTEGGVTTCDPEGCTFGTIDGDACAVGARTEVLEVQVDTTTPGTLVFTGLGAHAYPNCTIDFVTTWAKQ